jgi:ribosome-associated protein YbcJ (S4-like RNA binding protein)
MGGVRMNIKCSRLFNSCLFYLLFALYLIPDFCLAEMQETEVKPDGTTITRKSIEYYHPDQNIVSHGIVIGIVAVVGGIISILGVWLIIKALNLGVHADTADITIDGANKTIKMRKLTQGTVITVIGSVIMLGSLYFLTK